EYVTRLVALDDDRADHAGFTLEWNDAQRADRARGFPGPVDPGVASDHARVFPDLRQTVLAHRADLRILADRPTLGDAMPLGDALHLSVGRVRVPPNERGSRGRGHRERRLTDWSPEPLDRSAPFGAPHGAAEGPASAVSQMDRPSSSIVRLDWNSCAARRRACVRRFWRPTSSRVSSS